MRTKRGQVSGGQAAVVRAAVDGLCARLACTHACVADCTLRAPASAHAYGSPRWLAQYRQSS